MIITQTDYEKDDTFEKHRSAFLVWNSEMKAPVKVEKLGSSLDILPTVLNLFGVEYDSRLLMGRDILSNEEGLIIFSNRSFITSKGRYNSLKKQFEGEDVEGEYVDEISRVIYNKYQLASVKDDAELLALKHAISEFFARRADEEMEKLWQSGEWNEQTLQDLKTAHYRTPYQQ